MWAGTQAFTGCCVLNSEDEATPQCVGSDRSAGISNSLFVI